MIAAAHDVAATTPVLVGVGLVSQKAVSTATAREALDLMVEAAIIAGGDSGSPRLIERTQQVYVPQGRWSYQDPGRVIANRVGASNATTLFARVGVLQERLLGDASERIAAGDLDVALVVGGDAGYRLARLRKAGIEVNDANQDTRPDVTWRASAAIVTEHEIATGLGVAAPGYYGIIETAARSRRQLTPEANARDVDLLCKAMSEIAARNPHAWTREPVGLDELAPSAANPMIATPYTRLHCSDWSVDQASALLLCSAQAARGAGVPPDQWVFPRSSAFSDHMVPLSERERLDGAEGARLAACAALDAAELSSDQLDLVDLYSCYPAAVRAHAEALATREGVPPTITGGMRFAGGPFNNYVLHTTGQLALKLRAGDGTFGVVTSVSGMLTKHALGVWSSQPNRAGFKVRDVTGQVERQAGRRVFRPDLSGLATVAGYTVLHEQGCPSAAVAVLDGDDGERVIARSEDPEIVREFSGPREQCGRRVTVTSGVFGPVGATQ